MKRCSVAVVAAYQVIIFIVVMIAMQARNFRFKVSAGTSLGSAGAAKIATVAANGEQMVRIVAIQTN